jgi:uncharacterized protein (DUF2147 family)
LRTLLIVAALALISTSAHAKVHELKFGGRLMRIEIPKNCKKISCINVAEKEKSGKRRKGEKVSAARAAPVGVAAPTTALAAGPQDSAKAANPVASSAVATNPRTEPQAENHPDDRKPIARLSLPSSDEAKPTGRATEPKAEAVKAAEPSPLGVWVTEKGEGRVRVVECGEDLCGHTEGKPHEKILFNMRPGQKNRWNGKIHDVRSGRMYTSHMSLKSANALRVEGCAFGGLFCGGQTWTRAQ